MKIADSTRQIPDDATKPTNQKQTNKRPTIQFLPEKMSISQTLKKVPTGAPTPDLRVPRKASNTCKTM